MNVFEDCNALLPGRHAALARGWNTWDTRSVLRHVLLPHGLGVSLGFAAPDKLVWLSDAFFGSTRLTRTAGTQLTSMDKALPTGDTVGIDAGPHAYDGSYTELTVNLRGARFRVETAAQGDDWCAVIRPLQDDPWPRALTVHAGMTWNRPGTVTRDGDDTLTAQLPSGAIAIHVDGEAHHDANLPAPSPYLAVKLNRAVAVSAGRRVDLAEAERVIAAARRRLERERARYNGLNDAHAAMQSGLAWNVIYEPRFERVICTVARDWNCIRGGYAVFCWDGFLMAWMIALDAPALGYATMLEMFREMVDGSFVPNIVQGTGRASRDRSQPPVGSLCVLAMHRIHEDLDALRAAWRPLLAWNRWWHAKRRNAAGTISPGSDPAAPRVGDPAEFVQPGTGAGAALESGLDNSPVYDNPPFDAQTHLMLVEDVGLTSLYVADCEALAQIAAALGHDAAAAELNARAEAYRETLRRLWCEEQGVFLNRRLDDGAWVDAMTLTSFYPMLAGAATPEQAARMVREQLANPDRFEGRWIIPASPRCDATFAEQLYLRGRIWPPFNFLVYLGLKRSGCDAMARRVAENSVELLVSNWRAHGVVPENFSAVTGEGGRDAHTHPLHGWGGLLAMTALIEEGCAALPFDVDHPVAAPA